MCFIKENNRILLKLKKTKKMKKSFYRFSRRFKLMFLKFLFFFKKIFSLVKTLLILNNIFIYIKDYSIETLRSFFNFLGLGIRSYFSKVLLFQSFLKIYKRLKFFLLYGFIKYVMTFLFLLWIVFESFFFRFYLVDTPQDSKISKDRREISSKWWYRYLPLMIVESNLFYAKPVWRVFSTFSVFLSNLRAVFFILYVIYFEDVFFLFYSFFLVIMKFFLFFFSLFYKVLYFFYRKFFLYFIDFCFYFFLLRVYHLSRPILRFIYFLYNFPFFIISQFFRLVFLTFPKIFLFFYVFNGKEFISFYKLCQKHKKDNNKIWVFSSFFNFLFDSIILKLYIFSFYIHKKAVGLEFHPWFIFNIFLEKIFGRIYLKFYFFFVMLKFIYLVFFSFSFYILFLSVVHPFFI